MMDLKKIKKKGLVAGVLVAALATVGITYALLSSSSQQNINEFKGSAAKVNIAVVENDGKQDSKDTIHEDSKDNEKQFNEFTDENQTIVKKVKVKNVNSQDYPTTDCFIRVKLVPMIKNADGTYVGQKVNLSYNFNNTDKWVYDQQTDTYYYTESVAPDEMTELLLESVTLNEALPKDTFLELEVMADAVSAHPESNINETWNLTLNEIKNFTSVNELK